MTAGSAIEVGVVLPLALDAPEPLAARVEADLGELMHVLGVPRNPVVDVTSSTSPTMLITVDRRPCAVPLAAVAEASAYARGSPSVPDRYDGAFTENIGSDPDRLAEAVSLVCCSALASEAGLWALDPAVQLALDVGISVAELPPGRSYDSLAAIEELIAERARRSIDLLIDPDYLRDLTGETDRNDLFPSLREGLFGDLGLPLPAVGLRFDARLRPGSFALGFNEIRTMPRVGLAPGTILVNDTPERLKLMNVDAEPATNPANNQPYGATSSDHNSMLTMAGLTTWDPLEYLVFVLASEVRRHARRLLTNEITAGLLASIASAYPALVDAVHGLIATDLVTSVLRDLLTDGVSIRNLRRILELLLRYETDDDAQRRFDRVTYVRSGLADAIAYARVRPYTTLVVYLVDTDLERAFRGSVNIVETRTGLDEAITALRSALLSELSQLPRTAPEPVILTADDCRAAARAALRPAFPDVVVMGYGDVLPTTNVQPVARLGSP